MSAMRHGEMVPAGDESYDPNVDLRAHQSSHKRKTVDKESYLSREQLLELRKVQNERIEVSSVFSAPGGRLTIHTGRENEIAWDGYQANDGCSDGWDCVRCLVRFSLGRLRDLLRIAAN